MPFEMKAGLSLDKAEATLELPTMTEPLKMAASDLDEVIRHLAWIRTAMLPAHEPVDLVQGAQVSSVPAIRWQVTEDAIAGQFHLYLLHPGFEWLGIPMDRANFDKMSEAARLFLQAQRAVQ
jgi:hypothetical protein